MQYIIRIHDREYNTWNMEPHEAQAGEARPGPVGLPNTFHPLLHKLLDGDHIHIIDDGTIQVIQSPLREHTYTFPAILILADGKTYGRTANKKRLLYKCIPYNRSLPAFLVPYDLKMELSKHILNKYVVIKYIHWEDKHPLGELVETLGPVNSYDAFEQYQLHCKLLHTPIAQYTQHIKSKFSETDEKTLIQSITQQYNIQDRTSEYIFSIDNDTTTDYDDAMSITENPEDGTTRISIYIANVLVWLDALDGWEKYSDRVSTIYLPTRKIPMLPPHLSENLCSLIEKQTRFAIAMDYVIASDGAISISFSNTKIIVKKNYRYEKENLLLNPRYQLLFRISHSMDSSIKDSHDVVAYWMIKMNQAVGNMLYNNKKGVFRLASSSLNEEPCTSISDSSTLDIETERVLYNFYNHICSAYRAFQEGEIYKHSAMLLENYVHFTSPIRRLVDLLNQIYVWELMGNCVSLHMRQFIAKWTSFPKIDYINQTMKTIRKIQTSCELVHICYNIPDVFTPFRIQNAKSVTHSSVNSPTSLADMTEKRCKTYTGCVFDKQSHNNLGYEYTVYIKDLKHLARIVSTESYSVQTEVQCRLFVFHDKTELIDKIQLQIVSKN